MGPSPVLDTNILEPEFLKPEWPVCPGYLDNALSAFERHDQPFVLVSTLAMGWSGSRNMMQKEIDVLVRSSHLHLITDDLIASGEWKLSNNYAMEDENFSFMMNHTSIRDT
jgi:hypothetical protein